MAQRSEQPVTRRWARPTVSTLVLAVVAGAIAVLVRPMLPGGQPFDTYFESYLRASDGVSRKMAARIAHLGEQAASEIALVLQNRDATDQELEAAAELAGYTGARALVAPLADIARSDRPLDVRLAALSSLARLGGNAGIELLEESLIAKTTEIRIAALRTVGAEAAPGLLARVAELARTAPSAEERIEAIRALGRMQTLAARRALWSIYTASPEDLVVLPAAKKALARYPYPDRADARALAEVAGGYLPYAYEAPSFRAKRRLESRLRTLFAFRFEDVLIEQEEAVGEPCPADDPECEARRNYYRDLLRRKSAVTLETDGFVPIRADDHVFRGEPLLFVKAAWTIRDRVRYVSLSMARLIEGGPAIFPIRYLGFETFNRIDVHAEEELPAVGEVVSVSGRIRENTLTVGVTVPVAGRPTLESYAFEGGVFVPADSPMPSQ